MQRFLKFADQGTLCIYGFFFPGCIASHVGSLFPNKGSNPSPCCGSTESTTGLPGKSPGNPFWRRIHGVSALKNTSQKSFFSCSLAFHHFPLSQRQRCLWTFVFLTQAIDVHPDHWQILQQIAPHSLTQVNMLRLPLEDCLEKAMAPQSSTLAWKIHGRRSPEGCSPWGH